MSKHNYSQYSNKNTVEETVVEETAVVVEETPVVVEETPVETAPVTPVEPAVETGKKKSKPAKPTTVTGIVSGCVKLNVRVKPNITANPVCVVDAKTELKIDETKSNKDWFYVYTTAGAEGYCMRKFVEVK